MLERLPDFTRAAERWLEELGSGRRGAEREAEEALRDAQAQEAQAAAGIERLNRRYALEDDPASPKAEALLDVLVAQRQEHARAQRRAEQALEDLAAIRRTLSGDVLLVAQRSLEEALASGATTALADFNRRLREHFEGVLVLETGEAMLWKVAIPTAAPEVAATTV